MKSIFTTLAVTSTLLLTALPGFAAKTSCDDLKTQITAKVEGKSVKGFRIEVIAADEKVEQRVVGTCDGGKNKLVYFKK